MSFLWVIPTPGRSTRSAVNHRRHPVWPRRTLKSAIAAFIEAVSRVKAEGGIAGSVSLLITGDEEGPAINGTKKVLDWIADKGETIDVCLVGEPTNPNKLGEMVKIGRRGSLTGRLTVTGIQGHTAYPHLADNPLPRLARMLDAISTHSLTRARITFSRRTFSYHHRHWNPATNLIPASATAGFNIRFNDLHTGDSLTGGCTGCSRWAAITNSTSRYRARHS